jgi:hypothetical protein
MVDYLLPVMVILLMASGLAMGFVLGDSYGQKTRTLCTMDLTLDLDANTGNPNLSIIQFHGMKVIAPCGSEGFNLMESVLRGELK